MSNLTRLQAAMGEAGVEALLISDLSNVGWVSGFTGSFGAVLVTPSRARFITDSRYAIQSAEEVAEMDTVWFASPTDGADFIALQAKDMGLTRVGFEGGAVLFSTWEKWVAKFVGVELYASPDVIAPLRMAKSPEELEKIRNACKLADAAFEHIRRMLQPGMVEFDISLELEFFFRRNRADLAFAPIVVSGERSARPHGHASEKRLEARDFLTLDFGAKLEGYCSDITRTVVISEATPRHEEVYGAVLEAQLAALDAMRPGVGAATVDQVARDVLARHDLAQYFGHGLGHGLGSVVHDLGRMSGTSADILAETQVWTVEPGVYIPGFGGVRIEDDVVITASGIEILTSTPKALLVV